MPKVEFSAPFKFSPDGYTVLRYPVGAADVSEECARVAAQAGVLAQPEPESEPQPPKRPSPKAKK